MSKIHSNARPLGEPFHVSQDHVGQDQVLYLLSRSIDVLNEVIDRINKQGYKVANSDGEIVPIRGRVVVVPRVVVPRVMALDPDTATDTEATESFPDGLEA